jgi:hypothetical protein
MNTAFGFQKPVGKWSIKFQGGCFDTSAVSPLPVHLCHLPTLFLAIHAVHAGKHLSPILAFGATGPSIYLKNGRQFILRFIQCGFEFGIIQHRQCFFKSLFGFFFGGITRFPEIKENSKILYRSFGSLIKFYPVLVRFDVLENFGSPFIIIPETRA